MQRWKDEYAVRRVIAFGRCRRIVMAGEACPGAGARYTTGPARCCL